MTPREQPTTRAEIGEAIRRHRLAQGLTQKDLGQRVGISAQSVSAIEKGTRNPTLSLFVRLVDALDLSLALKRLASG